MKRKEGKEKGGLRLGKGRVRERRGFGPKGWAAAAPRYC